MKANKLLIVVLGLLMCVSTSAKGKKDKKSKKAVAGQVVKPDTVPMSTFSYAYGIA